MAKKRGFAAMSKSKQREIASKGGKAAHKSGKAHEWTSDEAKYAGSLGGRNTSMSSMDEETELDSDWE
jgi:uncharacterized protein